VGKVVVAGVEMQPRTFAVLKESHDDGHPAVSERGVFVPANNMDVLPLETLREAALQEVAKEAFAAAEDAFVRIQRGFLDNAASKMSAGETAQAEELYLRALAFDRVDRPARNPEWAVYFEKQYGRKVADVMAVLSSQMREENKTQKTVHVGRGWAFPSLKQGQAPEEAENASEGVAPSQPLPSQKTVVSTENQAQKASEGSLGLTDDELRELEDASLKESVKAATKEE
jgi:hypothetical protein